jgi:hypothetical protein
MPHAPKPQQNRGVQEAVLRALEAEPNMLRFKTGAVIRVMQARGRIAHFTRLSVAQAVARLWHKGMIDLAGREGSHNIYVKTDVMRWARLLPAVEALRSVSGLPGWSAEGLPAVTRKALLAADAYLRARGGDSKCRVLPTTAGGALIEWKTRGREPVGFGPDGARVADAACAV